jgi:membrane fusion protein (multidrug efflux system)
VKPNRRIVRRLLNVALRLFLLVLVPVTAAVIGLEMYVTASSIVSTENAYVKADKVAVSSDLSGRVTDVRIRTHERVEKGDILFVIDPRMFEIELADRDAQLRVVRQEVLGYQAAWREESRQLEMAQDDLGFFERESKRQRGLAKGGLVSKAKMDTAEHEVQMARRRIGAIREKLATAATRIGGDSDTPVERHPQYLQAVARRDAAEFDLERAVIRAPVSGVASRVDLQAGEYVEDGKPVFSIVQDQKIWITANLKETELTHIRLGHEATIRADAFPDQTFMAAVDSISPATGAEFSLLPPQNASGNWVKVVQRLPVRLLIHGEEARRLLRVGMSVTVEIDTGVERQLPDALQQVVDMVRANHEHLPFLKTGPALSQVGASTTRANTDG